MSESTGSVELHARPTDRGLAQIAGLKGRSQKRSQYPRAVVLGNYINALGLVRSLGRAGVISLVGASERGVAEHSRWARRVHLPAAEVDPRGFVEALIDAVKTLPERPVLFATADEHVEAVNAARAELEPYLDIPWADDDVLRACLDKDLMRQAARRLKIPQPLGRLALGSEEILMQAKSLNYPIIIKPASTIDFTPPVTWEGRSKVLHDAVALVDSVRDLESAGLGQRAVVLQEFVPGGTERLWTFTSYSDATGQVTAWSTGHKIRQYPPHAGTITAGRVVPMPELVRLGRALLDGLEYRGIANTEFKQAPDGSFKLIEVNPRPGMWNASALATGVNLPNLAYSEAKGIPYMGARSSDREVSWVFAPADLWMNVVRPRLQRREGLTLRSWSNSAPKPRAKPLWWWDDPSPGIALAWQVANRAFAKASIMARRRSRSSASWDSQ